MPWTLFESEFLIMWRMSIYNELINFLLVKSIVTVIDFCPQKELKISLAFFKSTMYLLTTLVL